MIHIPLQQWPYVEWRGKSVSSRSIGGIALVVCILAASTYNTFAKILTESLSPLSLFFISELLTGLFVIFSYGLMPIIRKVIQLPRKSYLPLLCIGLTNGTIAPLLLFPGLKMSTAVNASLFGNMETVFLIILAVIVLHEHFHREHMLSITTMFAGVLVIALRGFTEGLHLYPGDILLILSSLSFATGSVIFRKYLRHTEPHLILFIRGAVAVSCFFLISPFLSYTLIEEIRAFPMSMIPVLLGFGLISRFLNIFSFYEALDRLPVTIVSLFTNMTVISSIIFAAWILHEPILGYHVVGGAFLILGALILELAGMHPSTKHLEVQHRTRGPRA
ncbi:DMT family transporter [Candidatus Peribacteria bacterium]|nr:DMT family transporter [Candidatus Peribacteria bacterium]